MSEKSCQINWLELIDTYKLYRRFKTILYLQKWTEGFDRNVRLTFCDPFFLESMNDLLQGKWGWAGVGRKEEKHSMYTNYEFIRNDGNFSYYPVCYFPKNFCFFVGKYSVIVFVSFIP